MPGAFFQPTPDDLALSLPLLSSFDHVHHQPCSTLEVCRLLIELPFLTVARAIILIPPTSILRAQPRATPPQAPRTRTCSQLRLTARLPRLGRLRPFSLVLRHAAAPRRGLGGGFWPSTMPGDAEQAACRTGRRLRCFWNSRAACLSRADEARYVGFPCPLCRRTRPSVGLTLADGPPRCSFLLRLI